MTDPRVENASTPTASAPSISLEQIAKEKSLVITLAVVQFTHILDFMVLNPLGPMLNRDMNLSTDQFGLLVSSYAFAAAAAGLASTVFIDRVNRKTSLLWLYGLFMIATALCAAAPNYIGLLIARIFSGAFGGVLGALVLTYIGDVVHPSRRGRATGRVMSAFALSTVMGVPLGLWLANHTPYLGWRAPFVFVVLLSLFALYYAWRTLPSFQPLPNSESYFERMRETLSDKQHLLAFLAVGSILFSSFSVIPYITVYLVGSVKFEETLLPLMYFFGGFATLFTAQKIGPLADKVGRFKLYCVISLCALIPILATTHMPAGVHPALVIAVSTLFFILVSGRWIPLQAMLTAVPLAHLRGTFTTLSSCVQQLAMAAGAFVTGHMIVQNADGSVSHFNYAGYIAIGCTMLSLYFASKLKARS